MFFFNFFRYSIQGRFRKRVSRFLIVRLIFCFCLIRSWALNGMLVFALMKSVTAHDGVIEDVGRVVNDVDRIWNFRIN